MLRIKHPACLSNGVIEKVLFSEKIMAQLRQIVGIQPVLLLVVIT